MANLFKDSIDDLREEYLHLTNTVLPKEFEFLENHCFQRIVLDYVFQDDWRKHIS